MLEEGVIHRLRQLLRRERLGKEFEDKSAFLRDALAAEPFVRDALAAEPFVRDALVAEPFVRAALAEPEIVSEAVRLPDYARRTQAERYWLEDALDAKEFVTRQLDVRRGAAAQQAAFREDLARFRAAAGASTRLPIRDEDVNPQLADRVEATPFDRHYLYHPAWAARVLARTRPAEHVDVGSILEFSAILSAFVPTRFYDLRPADIDLSGLTVGAGDLTALPFADASIASLSCMHTLEHIGLGRYGDPIDPDGDLKAIAELKRVVAAGGDLLVATPVGRPRICFNAHRVYDAQAFASYFEPFEVREFALIEEHGAAGPKPDPGYARASTQDYGCGCFWFRRPA